MIWQMNLKTYVKVKGHCTQHFINPFCQICKESSQHCRCNNADKTRYAIFQHFFSPLHGQQLFPVTQLMLVIICAKYGKKIHLKQQLVQSGHEGQNGWTHGDVMTWIHSPHYCPFVRGIHRSSVDSSYKGTVTLRFFFSYLPEQAVEQAVEFTVNWDTMMLMWCHLNGMAVQVAYNTKYHFKITHFIQMFWQLL